MTLFILVVLSGCTAAFTGYPDRPVDLKDQLLNPHRYYNARALKNYYSMNAADRGGLSKEEYRNAVVTQRVHAIDVNFSDFKEALFKEGVASGIATEWAVLGLNAAAAVAAGPPKILSAVSGGLIGGKASFDKQAFFDRTMPALLAAMDALRQKTLVKLTIGMTKTAEEYPLVQALADVDKYYYAGSIPGAVTGITEEAMETTQKAVADLDKFREAEFAEDDLSKRIVAYVWKDGKRIDDDLKAIDPIRERFDDIQQFINADLGLIPLQAMVDREDLADLRRKVIEKFNIP